MPPLAPAAVGAQAPAAAQRASSIASILPIQAEGLEAAAAAAVAWQLDRGILAVYPAGTAVGVSEQRGPGIEQACEVHWVVERVERGPGEESLACVLTLSPCGKAWATGSSWDMATDSRPERSRGQMAPWERPV